MDFYGSKILRFDQISQYLFWLCYLQGRAEKNRESPVDGFVYHAKKAREDAKLYAKEAEYRDWEDAATNIGKAAELLHLFVDDSIDEALPFSVIKRKARKHLGYRGIKSLCLYF